MQFFSKAISILCLMLLTGCALSPVERVKSDYWPRMLTENALTTGEVSEPTSTYLSLRGWEAKDFSRPVHILSELREQLLQKPDRAGLISFSEFAYLSGTKAKNDAVKEKLLLTAARAAYAVMFDKEMGPHLDPLDPNLRFAANLYNYSLSQLIDLLLKGESVKRDKRTLTLVEGQVTISRGHGAADISALTDILVAFFYKTDALRLHNRRRGIGVPIVGVRPGLKLVEGQSLIHPPVQQAAVKPATLLLRFHEPWYKNGSSLSAEIELWNPLTTTHVEVAEKRVPLEADTSLALALLYQKESQYRGLLKMPGLLRDESVAVKRGLYLLAPYNPKKIPVIFTHGLMDSPLTWVPMLNALLTDPALNERYQFWIFFYPTMNPILQSASELRQSLHALHLNFKEEKKEWKDMVLVGHSMGGLISRLLITSSAEHFLELEKRALELTRGDEELQEYVKSLIKFEPLPYVSRALFMGTPHRGANMANRTVGLIGQSLMNRPDYIRQFIEAKDGRKERLEHASNSIANLAPDSLFSLALGASSWNPTVSVHSIIGDIWRAGRTNGTDSVVAYWSSHVEKAKSELIVRADHLTLHKKTPAINEVRRILLEHLEENTAHEGNLPGH